MKIGVISDTHDQADNILKMVEILNQEQVELVIHCGDWVAPFTLKFYKELRCPIKGIFGNNDGDKFRHLAFGTKAGVDVTYEERFLSLELDGRKIAVFHGDYEEIVDALVECGRYDAVFHGHNHQKMIQTVGKTLSLNPGTLMSMTGDDAVGASFAIYETKSNNARLIEL
jgi:uncharacterized protein